MRQDAERHRRQLIEAAARVFARSGPAASLQMVLAEAGLGRGTLYRHFRDRADLLTAVYLHEIERLAVFVGERRDDPAFFRDFLNEHGLRCSIHKPVIQNLQPDQVCTLLGDIQEKLDSVLDAVIAQAKNHAMVEDSFGRDHLHQVTHMLVGAASAAPASPEAAIAAAVDIILRGLRPDTVETRQSAGGRGP